MNKLLNFFNKFEISPFATVFISITLLTGSYKLFYIYFLITFIHELGHVVAAKIVGLKIDKIKLLAVGFNAEINDLDYTTSLKEFIVVLAGPLTYFISKWLLVFLYRVDFISYNAFTQANIINEYDFIFNLLPLIPLDGGRLLKIIIDNFVTCKTSLIIVGLLSNIFVIVFMLVTIRTPQWLIYVFLVFNNVVFFLTIDRKWKEFLINRLLKENKLKVKIHNKKDIYRNKNNYFIRGKTVIGEKEGILRILNNQI
jgi:stage IV sporulation protein FB